MFHVIWTTFKFSKNQLGTVSAFVMISVPWSNQRAHQLRIKSLAKITPQRISLYDCGPQVNTENCAR